MADKEERIWLEFNIPKPKGAIEATRCTTMTRQEAVDRMEKAICYTETRNKTCEGCPCENDKKKSIFWRAAEAALNSLLENK